MGALSKGVYPWQAAFVAFCNGVPEDEIAQVFEIPLDVLRGRMQAENWARLRTKLPLVDSKTELPAKTNAKLRVIEENRQTNYNAVAKLRDHAIEMIEALRDGKLRVKKVFNNKGMIVTYDAPPGPGDLVNISTHLRNIADISYRALGDFQAQEKAGQDANAGAPLPTPPAITIILPAAIGAPREKRVEGHQVIDLQGVKVVSEPNKV